MGRHPPALHRPRSLLQQPLAQLLGSHPTSHRPRQLRRGPRPRLRRPPRDLRRHQGRHQGQGPGQAECGRKLRGTLGDLVTVNAKDPDAEALARRIGGQASVRFSKDPSGREFDAVSDQSKPANFTLNKAFRDQDKATFEAALQTGRTPYFHFDGPRPAEVRRSVWDPARDRLVSVWRLNVRGPRLVLPIGFNL